ncbi:uncharacterized protein LOC121879051 [Homarus americanus]|uniref:uncharacterized protein LOC121879051 n=1 Tax=Homarus americanus TaxID=6706 RepID=UPI001C45954D|nr:uncharacterized protein LOC121879051 [Homarus americanus]
MHCTHTQRPTVVLDRIPPHSSQVSRTVQLRNRQRIMSKVSVVVVWAVVALLSLSMVTLPRTEAVAVADPEPCCGRLAAGALGFVGGYAIGRLSHRRCHRCGYGRRRRSLDEIMGSQQLEDLYSKIAAQDKDQCGLRLVCELAQKDPNHLTEDEAIILLPYRGRSESNERTYYGQYDKAVWHGQKGNPCHKLYSLCAYAAPEILVGYKARFIDSFQ